MEYACNMPVMLVQVAPIMFNDNSIKCHFKNFGGDTVTRYVLSMIKFLILNILSQHFQGDGGHLKQLRALILYHINVDYNCTIFVE